MSTQMEALPNPDLIPSSAPAEESGRVSSLAWTEMVAQIQAGDIAGLEQLYKVFPRVLRYYLARQLGV